MAYRVAIVDDSNIDAEYVQSILSTWAQDRQAGVQAKRFSWIAWERNTHRMPSMSVSSPISGCRNCM